MRSDRSELGPSPNPRLAHADEVQELEIRSIAAGGEGVARAADGRVVFVARSAPGDRVVARLAEVRPSFARARLMRIREQGPFRRVPPCPVYERCGGCQLQHLEPVAQRDARRLVVANALERIGNMAVPVPDPLFAGGEFEYRNRVRFTLRRSGGNVRAGFRDRENPVEVVDVADCPLAEAPVREAWVALRETWGPAASRLPEGAELQITVRGSCAGEVALLVEGGETPSARAAADLLDAVPGLVSVVWGPAKGPDRLLAGEPVLRDRWQGVELDLPPRVFLQTNREVSALMDRYLDERIGSRSSKRVADLYAGAGARAIRWATEGARVIACEKDRRACRTGLEAARRRSARVRFLQGDVERRITKLPELDVIVVNPPRRGLARRVTAQLALSRAARLAYVSCDPATLARDARRLRTAWELMSVQPFDAFPQTAHVECIAWFERRMVGERSGRRQAESVA